jgi:pyridoxal phosphate enzyme (YggS family)
VTASAEPQAIAARLAAVRSRLPASVTLVAVSKLQSEAAIREAYAAGQRHFGENYAQEWRTKADALADLTDLTWHFVGGLQTNKVKYLAPRAAWVHTLDREELIRELSKRYAAAGATARVLVEVNLGGERQKSGCAPERIEPLVALARQLPGLELAGLMCIPPPDEEPRPHFGRLRALGQQLGLRELSMGMSADWPIAVEEGATLIRLGTALFGSRGL